MERNKRIVFTSAVGIVNNVVLVIFKSIIGLLTNSIAIILDAVNNATDVLSSVITIIGTKMASKAPDKEHPYGHGRIEYFTALIIALIILFAGITAIKESAIKIINPAETEYSIISLLIVAVAVFVKFFLGRYVKKVGREVNSQSLVGSGQDAYFDAVVSFATLIAGILNLIWNWKIEGYIGIVISIFIIKTAVEMLKEGTNSIIGERADAELSRKIKSLAMSFEQVQGVYDLNVHNYGPSFRVASFHIQVRSDMTAGEIHILTRKITYKVYKELGIAVSIGIYAANDKGEFDDIQNALEAIVNKYDEILQIHGFYVDKVELEIYFDLIVDFRAKDKMKIEENIVSEMKKQFPEYKYNVILDPDITD